MFAAPTSAEPITALTTGSPPDLAPLPTGYESVGHHTEDDGINWSREIDTADVRSHGSPEPTRRDIVSDVSGLTVLAQESKRLTMELFHNIDLSAVEAAAGTNEIQFSRARTPATRYWRLLAVSSDGAGSDAIYFARFCPRATVTEFDDQAWSKGDEVRYPLTFTAFVDDVEGYAMREFWGGPGIAALVTDMGFTVAAGV